jgi:hypothetical protein
MSEVTRRKSYGTAGYQRVIFLAVCGSEEVRGRRGKDGHPKVV